jgi:phosphoglycerate dehydrogenase-like enzyme
VRVAILDDYQAVALGFADRSRLEATVFTDHVAVLTPHIGYVSGGTYERFHGDAVEDVRAFIAGAPVRVLT